MPTVDFHTHIFPPEVIAKRATYAQRDAWFSQLYADTGAAMADGNDLLISMSASGVDQAVIFSFPWADQGLCRACNDYLFECVSRWPNQLVAFAQVNPIAPGAETELERRMAQGFSGLGELMPDGQGYALDHAGLADVVVQMTQWDRPILIHAGEPVGHHYPGKSSSTLRPFYELAVRHPKAVLIAAHWGGGLIFYELMPEVHEALQNVYYDTAASLYLYQDEIFAIGAQIAPGRVLFATDFPLIDQRHFLRHVRGSGLSAQVLDDMLGNSAERLLGGAR